MNNQTISPDKIADVAESIDKIHCIFDQYQFFPSEGAAAVFATLERIGERQIEAGEETNIICDSLREAFDCMISHLQNFEETLND